jgi:hypothetical protein
MRYIPEGSNLHNRRLENLKHQAVSIFYNKLLKKLKLECKLLKTLVQGINIDVIKNKRVSKESCLFPEYIYGHVVSCYHTIECYCESGAMHSEV